MKVDFKMTVISPDNTMYYELSAGDTGVDLVSRRITSKFEIEDNVCFRGFVSTQEFGANIEKLFKVPFSPYQEGVKCLKCDNEMCKVVTAVCEDCKTISVWAENEKLTPKRRGYPNPTEYFQKMKTRDPEFFNLHKDKKILSSGLENEGKFDSTKTLEELCGKAMSETDGRRLSSVVKQNQTQARTTS